MSQLVTGEAVVLQVRLARMPTRALAAALDFLIESVALGLLAGLLFGFLLLEASPALAIALVLVLVVLTMIGYRVVMETLTRGRTVGKLALGLRVVRDDGSSIRFRHALVRGLMWLFVDFAPWFGCSPGIVASLMNKQAKRLGDMVAGTVVIRERHQPMASPPLFVPGHLVHWAQALELSRLSDELANTAREYLARYRELEPAAQRALGDALAFRVGEVTAPAPPVAISAPAFLSAVLAERRRRELARLAGRRPPFAGMPSPYAGAPSPYAEAPGPHGAAPGPYGAAPVPGPHRAPGSAPLPGPDPYGGPTGPFAPRPGQPGGPPAQYPQQPSQPSGGPPVQYPQQPSQPSGGPPAQYPQQPSQPSGGPPAHYPQQPSQPSPYHRPGTWQRPSDPSQ
jgi:uncharacterized RDD family membrane protein YckC